MKREIRWEPGFDKREEGYGIHGLQIRFLLHGENGVIQFLIMTHWFPKSARNESVDERIPAFMANPIAADLGYHSFEPKYDGQDSMKCDLLPEGKCFYDGSSLNAELYLDGLIEQGEEFVWKQMEEYYKRTFEVNES